MCIAFAGFMKTTQLKGSMHQSMQQETCGLKKHLLKLAVLVVGVCLLIVVNIGEWTEFDRSPRRVLSHYRVTLNKIL